MLMFRSNVYAPAPEIGNAVTTVPARLMKLSVGAASGTSSMNRIRFVVASLQSAGSVAWWMLKVSAVPVVWSIQTWTVDVITTFPADGTVRVTAWMFVQPTIPRPPDCQGVLRVLFIRLPGPGGPDGPLGPVAPFVPFVPFVPGAPAAPKGPGTARDRIKATIAITTATALSPIPIRPLAGGLAIGMGGAGIGHDCGGAGVPPSPYEGCMRVIALAGK